MTATQSDLAGLSRYIFTAPSWYASLGFALILAAMAGIAAFDSGGTSPTWRNLLILGRDAWQGIFFIGLPTVIASVGTTGVDRYVGGKLTDRIAPEYGIAGVYGVLVVLALAFLPVAALGLGPLLAFGAVFGATLFAAQPLYQATVADSTPAGTRGLSYGFTYLGSFGVGAFGGAVAGVVLTYADATTLFAVLAGFAAVASVLGVVLVRWRATGA